MKLFQLADQIELILAQQVDEHGEVTEETLAALSALEMEREKVALSIAAYIKGELAEAVGIEHVADGLTSRAAKHRRRAESLTRYLDTYCERGQALEDANAEIVWRKSSAVVVFDAAKLPSDCFRYKPVPLPEPDKKVIGDRLKTGETVPGAALEKRETLKVR